MSRQWSAQQRAIFEWFAHGQGNLVVRARAGTGKTTTIIEGGRYAPERVILYSAFGKKNAEDLDDMLKLVNPNATAATWHSVGFRIVRRMWERVRPENLPRERGHRAASLANMACGDQTPDPILRMVARLCSLGREMAPFATSGLELAQIAWDFDCIPDEEWEDLGWGASEVCAAAFQAMVLAKKRPLDGIIDFPDQVYLPLANGWARPMYDLVVVDEAQDLNVSQLELARRVARGRIAVVGDDRQAIYKFRGADSGSLDRLKRELRCTELGLTVTYRCGRAIVEEARALVPDYSAAATNPLGEVREIPQDRLLETVRVGDAILSRKNAPLIGWCLKLLKRGIAARVEGRDVATKLRTLVRELAKGRAQNSVPEFLSKLAAWEQRETARALASGEAGAGRAEQVHDHAEALRHLSEGVSGIPEMTARIEQIFTDLAASRCVILSSVHKAKGLEWVRVFLLDETFRTGDEEDNIRYVAITRAKETLVKVYNPDSRQDAQKAKAA
jgi:superfamily I DNA/RNA helicase